MRRIIAAALITATALLIPVASAGASSHPVHPHITGVPIKEASGSYCIRDAGGNDNNQQIVEGNCGSGPGENLAFESTGGSFEGFTTGEFHFTSYLNPDLCLAIDSNNVFAITNFCSGTYGTVFIEKPLNGAFKIVSRPCTQTQGSDCMLTGVNQANSRFDFGTSSGSGEYQRFVNN